GVPPSACFSTAMIWLSVNRDFRMGTSSSQVTRKFHFWLPLACGGITQAPASKSSFQKALAPRVHATERSQLSALMASSVRSAEGGWDVASWVKRSSRR
ncbi:MAG: hypothetical protein RH979_08085, partial [Algiphilus sp.]